MDPGFFYSLKLLVLGDSWVTGSGAEPRRGGSGSPQGWSEGETSPSITEGLEDSPAMEFDQELPHRHDIDPLEGIRL